MILAYDISNFMTWFITQIISIFTYCFTTIDNIQFGGTSLLKVLIFINIIVPFLYIIITIPNNQRAYKEGFKKGRDSK